MGIWVFALAWLTKGKADLALVRIVHRAHAPGGAPPKL